MCIRDRKKRSRRRAARLSRDGITTRLSGSFNFLAIRHILSDCRLSDLEAKLEHFTINVWGALERIRPAHLANERAQLSRDLRSANMVARSPVPIRSKPSAVPANDRLRPDNRNRAKDGGEPVINPNKQKAIGIVEVRSFRCPPAKHIDLLPQDQDFCFQLCSRLEERSQDGWQR